MLRVPQSTLHSDGTHTNFVIWCFHPMLCLPVAGQQCFSNNNPQLHTRCLQRLNELASVKWFQVCHVGRHSSSKSVIARTHLKRVSVNMQKTSSSHCTIRRAKSQVKSAAESFPALLIKFLRRRSFTVAQTNELWFSQTNELKKQEDTGTGMIV